MAKIIERKAMEEVSEILRNYPRLACRLAKVGLDKKQAAAAIKVFMESCKKCIDGLRDCQCWNDE